MAGLFFYNAKAWLFMVWSSGKYLANNLIMQQILSCVQTRQILRRDKMMDSS